MNSGELFYKINKKQNFIYCIDSNYYVIGAGVFRICSTEEIELYKTYKKELYLVLNLKYHPERKDLKKLHSAIKSILNSVHEPFISYSNHSLEYFLSNLSSDTLSQLDKLINEWCQALDICECPHHKK